jgi:hypothetical protein
VSRPGAARARPEGDCNRRQGGNGPFPVPHPLPHREPAKRLVQPYVFHPLRIPARVGGSKRRSAERKKGGHTAVYRQEDGLRPMAAGPLIGSTPIPGWDGTMRGGLRQNSEP